MCGVPSGFFLCPNDYRYDIDSTKSALSAHISSSSQSISWKLEVVTHCNPKYGDDDLAPAAAPAAEVIFGAGEVNDWRELAGRHFSLNYRKHLHNRRDENDEVSNLYLGYHILPIFHEISFGKRDGRYFAVKWHFEGSEDPELFFEGNDEPVLSLESYKVEGVIPFQRLSVSFPHEPEALKRKFGEFTPQEFQNAADAWEPDLAYARRLIANHFDPNDFGTPEKWMWSLSYPVIAND